MSLAAAVDVGSNTLRLLIARPDPENRLETVLLRRKITRLSQGLTPGGKLHPEAWQRSLAALVEFGEDIRRHGVEQVFGGATAAVRIAVDGDEFLNQVAQKAGLRLRKLPGEEEARLTALGALADLPDRFDPYLIVDPGGQSTEFIPTENGRAAEGISLNLGVVGLTEAFVTQAPTPVAEIKRISAEVREKLREVVEFHPPQNGLKLAGTAGTVTTIAAMDLEMSDYDPERVTGHVLHLDRVREILDRLAPLDLDRRRSLAGLERGREDVILAGLVLVLELMRAYGLTTIQVVDSGLLEGHIYDGLGLV